MSATFWRPSTPWRVRKQPPHLRRRRHGMDCGIDTSFAIGNGHYYIVHDHLRRKVVPDRRGQLCLNCLASRRRGLAIARLREPRGHDLIGAGEEPESRDDGHEEVPVHGSVALWRENRPSAQISPVAQSSISGSSAQMS